MTGVSDISYPVPGFPPMKPFWGFGHLTAGDLAQWRVCVSHLSGKITPVEGRGAWSPRNTNLWLIFYFEVSSFLFHLFYSVFIILCYYCNTSFFKRNYFEIFFNMFRTKCNHNLRNTKLRENKTSEGKNYNTQILN